MHAPVGLSIGAATPEEIAISVVAEMVAEIRHAEAAHALMSTMTGVAEAIGRKISGTKQHRQGASHDLRAAAESEAAPIAGLAANT